MHVMGDVATRLVEAGGRDLPLLDTLLQLFLHDLSEHLDPGELPLRRDGRFDWGHDALAWVVSSRRWAYLICHREEVVGMVLTSEMLRLRSGPGRTVDAWFILRPYRRRGLGRAIWGQLYETWQGYWELPTLHANPLGEVFASAGADAYASIQRGEQVIEEHGRAVRVQWFVARDLGGRDGNEQVQQADQVDRDPDQAL